MVSRSPPDLQSLPSRERRAPTLSELLPNLGDGKGEAAAAWAFDLTASIPSANFTPRTTFGNWLWPSSRRQLFSAASASLKIMASAVLFERQAPTINGPLSQPTFRDLANYSGLKPFVCGTSASFGGGVTGRSSLSM